ncbi:hypothetical protein NA78x_005319 [Anatilimnocola sp. NA78]
MHASDIYARESSQNLMMPKTLLSRFAENEMNSNEVPAGCNT